MNEFNLKNEFIVITDLHWGERKNSKDYFDKQMDFFNLQLFPYMKENGLIQILCLGDFFHDRRSINVELLDALNKQLFPEIENNNFTFTSLLGNHDIYFRNSHFPNSLELFAEKFKNFNIISELTYNEDKSILFVPWILPNDFESWTQIIKESQSEIIFGHFEINGFVYYDEINSGITLSKDIFPKQSKIYSGHFHTPQTKGNIQYLGSTFYQNWSSKNQTRGFYHFKNNIPHLIENLHSRKFLQFNFNNEIINKNNIKTEIFDYISLKVQNNFIKLFVSNNEMENLDFIILKDTIEKNNPYEFEIVPFDDDVYKENDEIYSLEEFSSIFDFENISSKYLEKISIPENMSRETMLSVFKEIIQISKNGNQNETIRNEF